MSTHVRSVAEEAAEVLRAHDGDLDLAELGRRVSSRLGRDVGAHTLRAAVYYHLKGDQRWFERTARGRYRHVGASDMPGDQAAE